MHDWTVAFSVPNVISCTPGLSAEDISCHLGIYEGRAYCRVGEGEMER